MARPPGKRPKPRGRKPVRRIAPFVGRPTKRIAVEVSSDVSGMHLRPRLPKKKKRA